MCVWHCLAIYRRKDIKRGTEFVTKAALNFAREYYGDNKLKRKDVRPAKLVEFEGIAGHHNVNIMLYEPKKDRGKDAGSIWWLVYGKIQYKSDLPTVNMRLLGGNCFYIKKMDVLCKRWECKKCKQLFTRDENLIKHFKEERCTGRKTKIICSGGKFRHILNSSEKVFYGGETKFSYTACQWIEAEAVKIGKHIHHKMCGHGGERMVKVQILNDKGRKEPVTFLVDGYEPEANTVYHFHGCHWHGHTCLRNRSKRKQKRYKDTCKIDWLIENNGWDTKFNLVSAWGCEKPVLKKVWFEKRFTPYPHFIVYDFEATVTLLNKPTTDDLFIKTHTLKRCYS